MAESGLTPDEQRAIDLTVELWNQYVAHPEIYRPEDLLYVQQRIHELQHIVAMRAMARMFPEYWSK